MPPFRRKPYSSAPIVVSQTRGYNPNQIIANIARRMQAQRNEHGSGSFRSRVNFNRMESRLRAMNGRQVSRLTPGMRAQIAANRREAQRRLAATRERQRRAANSWRNLTSAQIARMQYEDRRMPVR